jgi:uncharacterized protein YjbI with pentapeptide repeats
MRIYVIGGHEYTVVMTFKDITPAQYAECHSLPVDRKKIRQLFQACDGNEANIRAWNEMRSAHWHQDPSSGPNLSSEDDRFLAHGVFWFQGDDDGQVGMDLLSAELEYSSLVNTELNHAKLDSAKLIHADLTNAKLNHATLGDANLAQANFTHADMRATFLRGADLSDANVFQVQYDLEGLDRRCMGVRVATCFGHALFKRDVEDADFIDTYRETLCDLRQHFVLMEESTRSGRMRHRLIAKYRRSLFWLWGLTDYGRSFGSVFGFSLLFIWLFGFGFGLAKLYRYGILDYSSSADTFWTPFYFSLVTYTTLGFGDVTPANSVGELAVIAEVLFGYFTLGLLVSILANKVARRA